jgi:hypothetical protein
MVPLTHGKFAEVDDADYELLSAFPWRAVRIRNMWYAETYVRGAREFMHRFLLGAGPGEQVDHRDGDGLHNWRRNLRSATHSLNQSNTRRVRSKSGFKGVTWGPLASGKLLPWRAYIQVDGHQRHLGRYLTAQEAARAYDRAAREAFGEFACTNEDLGLLPHSQT